MTTTSYTQQGRNLRIDVDGIDEPFIISPLPGFAGELATELFLQVTARKIPADDLEIVWQLAVDGVDEQDNTILGGPIYTRIGRTLSLSEAEAVLIPAFYWQTTLGIEGVNAFVSGGEGLAGAKKALELLIWTLGISPTQTSRSSALETLIQKPGLTPLMSSLPAGKTVEMLPPSKRGFMQNRAARRKKA